MMIFHLFSLCVHGALHNPLPRPAFSRSINRGHGTGSDQMRRTYSFVCKSGYCCIIALMLRDDGSTVEVYHVADGQSKGCASAQNQPQAKPLTLLATP
jgi:hypothetical protein